LHPANLSNSGLGFLAFFGLLVVILAETLLKQSSMTAFMAPHSWWLMSGYITAAVYCILLHLLLKRREMRLGYDAPGARHKLARLPIRYWSIVYLVLGLLRVAAAK
jgi:hypothetical protein